MAVEPTNLGVVFGDARESVAPRPVPRSVRRLLAVTAALITGVLLAGCAPSSDGGITVPTFQAGGTTQTAGGGGPAPTNFDETLAADCNPILAPADLGALFGMPLDSVGVRSTLGVPAPSVNRTERLACRYSGTAGGPARGQVLLDVNIGRYADTASAAAQWSTNAGVESGARRDLMIGAAQAAVFDRARDSTLMVTYDDTTITLILPERPLPGGQERADVLVDVALRVLGVVEPPSAPPTATSTPVEPPAIPVSGRAEPARASGSTGG